MKRSVQTYSGGTSKFNVPISPAFTKAIVWPSESPILSPLSKVAKRKEIKFDSRMLYQHKQIDEILARKRASS